MRGERGNQIGGSTPTAVALSVRVTVHAEARGEDGDHSVRSIANEEFAPRPLRRFFAPHAFHRFHQGACAGGVSGMDSVGVAPAAEVSRARKLPSSEIVLIKGAGKTTVEFLSTAISIKV